MVSLFLWTLLPIFLLHLWLWRRSTAVFRFQLVLDVILVVVVGPALVVGGDLNPVRSLQRNRPFEDHQWSSVTAYQPTQSDLVLQFHPWWEAAREDLRAGRMPLIAENMGGGLPLLANGQTGLWAPMMLPVWALGPERGSTVMAFWKIELAGLGAFLLLWRVWRLRWSAAALGAVAYAGGAYQIAWLLVPLSWVTAMLPWSWWMVHACSRRRARRWAPVAVGLFCGWLLGSGLHPETAAIVIGSAMMAGLILHPRRWARVAVIALVMVVVAAALALPTIRYIGASARLQMTHEVAPNSQPVPAGWRFTAARQMVLPTVNGHPGRGDWRAPFPHAPAATGVGGAVLGLLLIGRARRRYSRLLWAALACLAVAALLYFRLPPLDRLLVMIPPFDRMTLARFAALVPWGMAVAAALAADGALRGRLRSRGWLGAALAILTLVAGFSHPAELQGVDRLLLLVTVAAVAAAPLLIRRPRWLAPAVAIELGLYALGINPVAAVEDRLPKPEIVELLQTFQSAEGGRIIGLDGVFPSNLASRYGLPDLRAYDPVRPLPYVRLLALLGQQDPVLGGPLRTAPAGLCGAWSVRFLLTGPGAGATGWEPVWVGESGAIWRNPRWLPELRVVGETLEGGWDVLASRSIDFATTAVVSPGTQRVSAATAEIVNLEKIGSRVTATVHCDGPCLAVLARPWAPGWRVTVDGSRTVLVRANLAGLGAVIPPGDHEVEFSYNPWLNPLLISSP